MQILKYSGFFQRTVIELYLLMVQPITVVL
nr:MAG TPA: hypothetical protein [Bacteriophage sp.]